MFEWHICTFYTALDENVQVQQIWARDWMSAFNAVVIDNKDVDLLTGVRIVKLGDKNVKTIKQPLLMDDEIPYYVDEKGVIY